MEQPTHDMRPMRTSVVSPRRWFSLAAVGVLHVVLIWALASGLAAQLIKKPLEELKAEVVQEKPPEQPKEPPPPPPDLQKPPPPFVPPPDINIQADTTNSNAIVVHQDQQKTPAITAPASVGRAHSCERQYPPSAQRLGHEGVTTISFQIQADGSVANVTVTKPSGFQELDDAAIRCASSWRYKPAIQNGVPIAVPWTTNVTWRLK